MHLIYVADTVDELIYSKADWTDLTGEESNRYWRWPCKELKPDPVDLPPRTPRPTEEQAWAILGREVPDEPAPWPGCLIGQEYSVKTNGAVHNQSGLQIGNPQGVDRMVERVRGRPGGRFRVTPEYRLVLVWQPEGTHAFVVAGQLSEPFRVLEQADGEIAAAGVDDLRAGDAYTGPADKKGGTFKVAQRAGGIIERKIPGGSEVAQVHGTADPNGEENGRRILAAWECLDRSFSRFFVNSLGHAWYETATGRRFLAVVEGGFAWPEERGAHR
ncbi:hypothetical protein AWC02_00020 [Mycolicibacter engbaekii]|uniref:Uncharacterized protein n=2 Tax=Mycolicibacter engbaekii TaxID=188915 RepID=A0A1X1UD85_9MYCO|nr:hypothetical protein AWC02_00020 [Mycolicibacter engbaekii]